MDSIAKEGLSCGIVILCKNRSVWSIDDLMVRGIHFGPDRIRWYFFAFLSTDRRELIACPEKSGNTIKI